MAERITDEDLELLNELGVDAALPEAGGRTAKEQRIIAGFEDIERFVEKYGRRPEHGEERDIFERLYAVRLDRILSSAECRAVLAGLDRLGLLGDGSGVEVAVAVEVLDDDELLSSLTEGMPRTDDITQLVHVRSRDEIRAAEEIAKRSPCEDFVQFKPIFEKVQRDLSRGDRRTVKYGDNASIKKGDFFILEGQKVVVADLGDEFVSDYGRPDRRLRVVYDNGTESDLLLRSLQRALYKDKTSRRIAEPENRPLFSDIDDDDDLATGYIYVLRSKSTHPFVEQHRDVLHKIGVTGEDVKSRVAGARKDPTYLLADVEIVATYKLANVNRKKLEALLHRFFGAARLDLELKDRFGGQVEPREWFLVPITAIDEAVQRIMDGSLEGSRYVPETASLSPPRTS